MDLLTENNICGQTILRLVARGNSILGELLRLSNYIPSVFRLECKVDQQKYEDIILDFSYFKFPEGYDKRIEDSQTLLDLDEEVRESHGNIVGRIYSVFESIHRYISDLLSFIQDLKDGIYFQKTLENIFGDEDGKQLMCEALYLYGSMLLLTDTLFPGIIRERIIVSYHRNSCQKASGEANIDDVCKLLRSTGYVPGSKRPLNYPEGFFKRIDIPEDYVVLVVGYLRSDDIYHQVQAYPLPDQRTTALSTQAGMLFVCLFFTPSTLHNHTSRMREIIDKFFSDNWIISYYMGHTVNLVDIWDSYKAAKSALNNTVETSNVKEKTLQMKAQLAKLVKQTERLTSEGGLSEQKVLDHGTKILNMLRECNVTLRWMVLHTAPLSYVGGEQNKRCVALRQQVVGELQYEPLGVFSLLLNTAILEVSLTATYKNLVNEKEVKWDLYRKAAFDEVKELADVFTGLKPLAKVPKNDKLNQWFSDIAEQISALNLNDPSLCGRKIIQMIQALKDVKEFHELDTSAGVVQAVGDAISNLQALVKVASITDDDLVTLALVSDLSYAWKLIDSYTSVMQESIKKDPSNVAKLRALFLKLSSGLELPLLRINQAKSPDMMSVSAYYSGQLVDYIRKVLQIIPETMFHLLEQIIQLQTSMKEIPTRLDKDKIRDFAQLDERYKMAELTQRVAVLADGVSMMESTLVGVVQIDPKKLLEEGVRRELVLQVARSLHEGFIFNPKAKTTELKQRLEQVGHQMRGFQTSFEYIQDYINMYGLKLWQEEISRIVSYNVEQECNQLLKKKISDHESSFQSTAIPIPKFPPTDTQSDNFVGRLLREMLRVTNPKTTVYISQVETWYDSRTHQEVLVSTIMAGVEESICVAGLAGIDRLLGFHIVKELQEFVREVDTKLIKDEAMLEVFAKISQQLALDSSIVSQPQRNYSAWIQKTQKLNASLLDRLLKVGQMQILRTLAASRLNSSCKFQSKLLSSAMEAFNVSLMSDVKKHYTDSTRTYPDPDGTLTSELSMLLEWCGMSDPPNKIYVIPKPTIHLSTVIFMLVISLTNKIYFSKNLGSIVSIKGSEGIDGPPLVMGITTLLHQFHADYTKKLLMLLAQYITSYTLTSTSQTPVKIPDLPSEAVTALAMFQEIAIRMGVDTDAQTSYLPLYLYTSHYS